MTRTEPSVPYLLTPGPLTTAPSVRQAMLRDWGSRDDAFIALTQEMRARLVAMLEEAQEDYDCVPMQGSGTFSVEAMLNSFIPSHGKALIPSNGAYARRIAKVMACLGRSSTVLEKGDGQPLCGADIAEALARDPEITHVVAVHCETSSGMLNPLSDMASATRQAGRRFLIDSMSAFGALPLSPADVPFDAVVSSANKCIEGVPGFAFIVARKDALEAARGNSRSLSLDVHDQWSHMNRTGQWRFTPPTQCIAAFVEALRLHEAEGGVAGRGARYARNRDVLVTGMRDAGFVTLLDDRWQSPVIVTFLYPADAAFDFDRFYERMKAQGFVIYPGKQTEVESFRIGCIGDLDEDVMRQVVAAARASLEDMGVANAAPSLVQTSAEVSQR